LWNDALNGTVSTPTARAASQTSAATSVGVTSTAIIANQVENAQRWKELRDQMDAIIDWDSKAYK
jgi:hypothetical protein